MNKIERLREKYPIVYAYGAHQQFLDDEETAGASVGDRIRSVWPFVVGRALAFHASLKPRERCNFDPEDVLIELWVAIASKDHLWTADRGKFITFAGMVVDRALCTIREQSRTVHSPRNAACRTKEYEAEHTSGSIKPQRYKTMGDIQRTSAGIKSISSKDHIDEGYDGHNFIVDGGSPDPSEETETIDSANVSEDAITRALSLLSDKEAYVLESLYGLGGKKIQEAWHIAWMCGLDEEEVKRIACRATKKIKDHLIQIGHTVAKGA